MSEKVYKQRRTAQAEDVFGTIGRMFREMKPFMLGLVVVFICITIASLTNIASAAFNKTLIDDYLVPLMGKTNPDLSAFIKFLFKMITIYVIGILAGYIQNKTMSLVSTGMLSNVRTKLFNHMENMPIQFFDTHTHGDLMSSFSNDVDMMRPFIANTLPQLYSTLFSIVGTIYMMLKYNVVLTFVTLGMLVIICIITFIMGSKVRKFFTRMMKANSNINGYSEEMFQGQKVVKVFCHEDTVRKEFAVFNNEATEASVLANTYSGMLMPINMNLSYVTYALISVVGAAMCIKGTMTLGVLSSFLSFSRQISGPISNLSQQFNGAMMSIAGAERVFKIMDTPTEVDEGNVTLVYAVRNEDGTLSETDQPTRLFAWKDPDQDQLIELKGDVRLHDVTFSYEPGKVVLKNVSFYAKPGQKIAFVGSTGAGKTTITNLINRFYDVEEGSITYDGIDVKRIKKDSLRNSLGVVLQDTNLFSGTVMDNIRYGRLDATDEECIAAAKLANAHSFIRRLPDGYNTMLTANGSNLSQGQRQLLNIARAAVANSPALILDEATSSIDTHTERLIGKGMDELMAGRTVFVIAHRLSTIRDANAIIVLEHGEVIERGDHEDLLAQKGRYYQLYTGKAELD
ncbi:MAG: ABC transporter ATP-binding protein [Erysipelotrichaceae bacterium]|nr:ABC transporter ATP-binding protein [Erysipelotrichaceae bacterium]